MGREPRVRDSALSMKPLTDDEAARHEAAQQAKMLSIVLITIVIGSVVLLALAC